MVQAEVNGGTRAEDRQRWQAQDHDARRDAWMLEDEKGGKATITIPIFFFSS